MPSKSSNKTLFAKGVVGCKTSVTALPFNSDVVDFEEASDTLYGIFARNQANDRAVFIYINKDISPGTYSIGEDKEVHAYYYHRYEDFGWSYYAHSGTFTLNSVDFDKTQLDGTFSFKAPGMKDEPELQVTDGVVSLTGPLR